MTTSTMKRTYIRNINKAEIAAYQEIEDANAVKTQRTIQAQLTPMPLGLRSIPNIVSSGMLSDETKDANAAKFKSEKPLTMNSTILPIVTPKKPDGEIVTFTSKIEDREETLQEKSVNTVVFINPTTYRNMSAYEHIEVTFDNSDNGVIRTKIMLHEKGITRKTRYLGTFRYSSMGIFGLSLKNTKSENDLITYWAIQAIEKRKVGLLLLLQNKLDNDGLPLFVEGYNAGKRQKYLPLVTAFAENAALRKGSTIDTSKVTSMPHTLATIKPYED